MIQILISSLIALGLIVGSFNVPASWFDVTPNRLGASVTTLVGTENLSDFPTLYNANLNSLNNTKLESGDTASALTIVTATAGALTATGTVTFSTGLAETNGGTGQQTYTTGDLLYASASNVLSKLGIGSNGESLVISGGLPAWSSLAVNESLDYDWTGYNTSVTSFFTSASTTNATSTTSHYFPFLTSTLLKTDSAGKLSAATRSTDYGLQTYTLANTTDVSIAVSNAFATSTALVIPASTATASSTIKFSGNLDLNVVSGTMGGTLYLRKSDGTTLASQTIANTTGDRDGFFNINMFANNSVSAQVITIGGLVTGSGGTGIDVFNAEATATETTSSGLSLVLVLGTNSAGGNGTWSIDNFTAEYKP